MLHAFKISFKPTPKYPFRWKRVVAMSIISDLVSIPVVVHPLHTNWSVLNYIKNFSYKSRFIFVFFLKTDSYGGTSGQVPCPVREVINIKKTSISEGITSC